MGEYSRLEPGISQWAARHDLVWIREWSGSEARFCYISGGQQECFQISIDLPDNRQVRVNAWDVETIDDSELHDFWTVPIDNVESALASALIRIESWVSRPKRPATWRLASPDPGDKSAG